MKSQKQAPAKRTTKIMPPSESSIADLLWLLSEMEAASPARGNMETNAWNQLVDVFDHYVIPVERAADILARLNAPREPRAESSNAVKIEISDDIDAMVTAAAAFEQKSREEWIRSAIYHTLSGSLDVAIDYLEKKNPSTIGAAAA